MNKSREQRYFTTSLGDINSAFLPSQKLEAGRTRVAFVLLEHFSMMAFTAAVDCLVTANLVSASPMYEFATYGLDSLKVKSDLGIDISASGHLCQLHPEGNHAPEIIIVCGGYRCSLSESTILSAKLKAADKRSIVLGGLWNGAVSLAHAGLLDQRRCALHPDNHIYMREMFANVSVTDLAFVVDGRRATCAGPSSALEMMLTLIAQFSDRNTVRAIREILSCDQAAENMDVTLIQPELDPRYPALLQDLLAIMASNIEEPLTMEELASYTGYSRRRIERLFQAHLETSPSRYYLELRITNARRLLIQSNNSVTNIAVACGFVSATHFSHCFKDYFGVSPSQYRSEQQRKN